MGVRLHFCGGHRGFSAFRGRERDGTRAGELGAFPPTDPLWYHTTALVWDFGSAARRASERASLGLSGALLKRGKRRAAKWMWINWAANMVVSQRPPLSPRCRRRARRAPSVAQYSSTSFPLDGLNMAGLINFSQRWSRAHHLLWDNHICASE